MAWITQIEKDKANSELRQLYENLENQVGDMDHILKVHGCNPNALESHVGIYQTLMFGDSPLSRNQREMLALVVASTIGCQY
jgi:alkylhydroperoxidase family enzyme